MSQQLQNIIETAWEDRANINPANGSAELRDAVNHVLAGLDGSIRVAEKPPALGGEPVGQEGRAAVVPPGDNVVLPSDGTMQFYDKVPTKFANYTPTISPRAASAWCRQPWRAAARSSPRTWC
jgi:2,3,4,5-tetrahydropyridine-2-carboxylate N-succinyltransferase